MDLSRAGDVTAMDAAAAGGLGQGLGGRYPLEGRHVCPFCGAVNETMEGPCPTCTMTNTADTRKATKSRIGPWYVLQSRNPAAPGMRYETLLGFVRKGRVKARSIVRGPTTHQLWRFACQVKGISREFGLCYSCGGSIDRDAQLCPQCNRLQDPPADPDLFLESQVSQGGATLDSLSAAAAPTPRPATPAEALQESRPTPIFKELKLPPLDFPSIAPAPAPTTAPAPTPSPAPVPRPAPTAPEFAPLTLEPLVPSSRPASPAPSPKPAPAPPAPAPQAAAPEAPPKRNANDVFLSAKDLAAAFQLGFDDESDDRPRGGTRADAEAPWGGSAAAAHATRPARRMPRRKRRVGRTILLVLVLAIGGFAAYLAIDAATRQRVFGWAEAQYMALTGANLYPDLARQRAGSGTGGVTPPSPSTVPSPAASPSDDGPEAGPAAAAVVPSRPTVSVPDVSATDVSAPSPSPRPNAQSSLDVAATPRAPAGNGSTDSSGIVSPQTVAPPATAPVPPPRLAAQPQTQPRASQVQPDRGPVVSTQPPRPATRPAPQRPAEPRPMTTEEARKKSAQLWADALSAEDRGEYQRAKGLYEQMMKLPREVWYRGVEGRLQFAKDQLGEK